MNLPNDCTHVIIPCVGIHEAFSHLLCRYCVEGKYEQNIDEFS